MRQPIAVVLKPEYVRPSGDIATQHALDVPPRTVLVTQDKAAPRDQTVPDRPSAGSVVFAA